MGGNINRNGEAKKDAGKGNIFGQKARKAAFAEGFAHIHRK